MPETGTDSIDELRAIAQARRLLGHDPQAALSLLDRVARAHPSGYFVEEREALRVLALMAAGQSAQAKRRADAFLRVYPSSPFADRVRAARDH
jgi:outer membrane protein assembly factor BamD (BamD/ComL family)